VGDLLEQPLQFACRRTESFAHGTMLGGERRHLGAQPGIFLAQLFHRTGERHGLVVENLQVIEHGRDVNKCSRQRIISA